MGYIKEPEGVDLIIQSKPLTEKDKKEISKFIQDYKQQKKHSKRNDTSLNKKGKDTVQDKS
jgi:hypothetical protein